jgi:DNA-binding CsgD family transcriptional regulator
VDDIVGRDAELEAIEHWLVRTAPFALLIEGEAGIGKTTLWRAGVEAARARGYRVLQCAAAQSETRLSFTGLRDLIDDVFDEAEGLLPAPQRRALAVTLLRAEPDRPPDRGTIAVAVLSTLRALSAEAPTVLAVDDVNWLDRPSADVLSFVARRLGDDPVALLLAQRGDGGAGVPLRLDRALGERLQRVKPRPLSLGATHRLLSSRLGLTLTRPTLRRLHSACGGNPLFALEIGRALEESDESLRPDEPLPIPPDVEQLLARRIRRLSEPGREAVLAAALQAEPSRAVVVQVAEEAGLDEAVAAGVLVSEGDRLRFTHALLTETTTSLTPESSRRDMHRRLSTVVADPETQAQHLALGTTEPAAHVATTLDRAADAARRHGAVATAAVLAEHAARLTPETDAAGSARRRIDAALWWTDAGDTRRSLALVEPLLAELPRGAQRLEALYAKARAVRDHVHTGLLENAVAEAEGHPRQQVRLLFLLCYALLHGLEFDLARERARTAVRVAEQTRDPSLIVLALGMAGRLDAHGGGLAALQRARELEPEAPDVDAYESSTTWLGWWLLANDELDGARRLLSEQWQKAIAAGDEWNQTFLHWPLTELECRAGNYDAARRYAEVGLELAEQSDNLYAVSALQCCRALVAAHMGDGALARGYADESLANATALRSDLFGLRPRIALAYLAVSEGGYAEARDHLEGLTTVALEGPYWATYPFWGDLFESLVALDEVERAQGLLADLDARAYAAERPGTRPILARCRGLVLAASGSLDEGSALLEEALRLHGPYPAPLERGRTLHALGTVQRRQHRRRAARATLQEAVVIFEALGSTLWAAKARAELGRMGGRAPSRGDLTPTEQRVAGLVAEGKSNKEVAAELVVSVHTVEAALTSVYRKLGVRSRTEMARKLAETAPPKP